MTFSAMSKIFFVAATTEEQEMAIRTLVWKLASPYDAYVSHVSRLNDAIVRIQYLSDRALAYEAGLQGSIRLVPGEQDPAERARRFRERVGAAAEEMSEEQFEEFISHLGGGEVATVERDRAQTVARMGEATRAIEEHFAAAGREVHTLASRGYDPARPDVRRQLRANRLPELTVDEFRHQLAQLGRRVGKSAQ